jgi:hypothetical protein
MITPRHVLEGLLDGPFSDVLFQMIQDHIATSTTPSPTRTGP